MRLLVHRQKQLELVDGVDAAPAADVIRTAGAAISNPRVSFLSVSPLEVTTARGDVIAGGQPAYGDHFE